MLTAALAMSTVLALFEQPIVSGAFKAPQANLIKLVIDGVVGGGLPWALVLIGAAMAFAVEIMGLPTLAFAVGLYLPVHLATPIMAGGLLRLWAERRADPADRDHRREVGVLVSSGLIAGAALIGVFAATLAFFGVAAGGAAPRFGSVGGVLAFAGLCAGLLWAIAGRLGGRPPGGDRSA